MDHFDVGDVARQRPAPRGYRLLARTVDVTVLAFTMAFVYVEIVHRLSGDGDANLFDASTSSGGSMRLTFLVLSALYEVVPVALSGRTFGKLMLGLKVERIDGPSEPVGFVRSFGRWLVPNAAIAIPMVGPFVYLAVVGIVAFDPRRQGLHDRLAGTVVLDVGIGHRPVVERPT